MSFCAFERYALHVLGEDPALFTVEAEEQTSDYESGVVLLGQEYWRLRTARITPSKPGGFVAVWRRTEDGATAPFPAEDSTAGLLVFVQEVTRQGSFGSPLANYRNLVLLPPRSTLVNVDSGFTLRGVLSLIVRPRTPRARKRQPSWNSPPNEKYIAS